MLKNHSLLEKFKSKPKGGMISHWSEWPWSKNLRTTNTGGRCVEKGTLLHCWWECKLVQPLWRTLWRFLKKLEIEQQSHGWAHTLRKRELKETRVPRCSLWHCLQWLGHRSNPDVHWQMNG